MKKVFEDRWTWQDPKPKRVQDKKYLEWIKSLPCLVRNIEGVIGERGCRCVGDIAYHHVSTGGMGTKGSDYETVPLCFYHHIGELHSRGRKAFHVKYNIDLKEEAEMLKGKWDGKA